MTLEEYATDFRQGILAAADVEDGEGFAEDVFTGQVIEMLTEAEEADDHEICNCRRGGSKSIKINAYNLSSDNDRVDLFVSCFHNQVPPPPVSNADVQKHLRWAENFLSRALTTNFHTKLEESSPEFDAAQTIRELRGTLTRARIFFLTDGITKVGAIDDTIVDDLRVSYHVWDIQRCFRIATSGEQRESIEVDFAEDFDDVVTCLGTTDPTNEYTTYLGFFPGRLLVQLYEKYGPRLLERNVRSFLQARGKINKGIRQTILEEPQRFLAYNNGISATAEHLDAERNSGGVLFLTRARGFQIVNGGQTTASLYTAFKKDKADVSKIYVQVKITVPKRPADIDELSPKISQFANSQNKVNAADFSANHVFHRQLQERSRTIWAPAADGSQQETRWFYERARGQYLDEKSRAGTPSKQKVFEAQHPTRQKFTKTDLAKFENSWSQLPHLASRGAEKNFVEFMARMGDGPAVNVDEAYFQRIIAKAILFRESEKIVHAQQYGGYRANIVTYLIAWLSHHTAQRLDLQQIWREQGLDDDLTEVVRVVSKHAHDHITNPPGGANVTEWCKKEACWTQFRGEEIPLRRKIPLLNGPAADAGSSGHNGQSAVTDDNVSRVATIEGDIWFELARWAKETNNLQGWQRKIAFSLGKVVSQGRNPSPAQAVQGVKIMDEAERLGFKLER